MNASLTKLQQVGAQLENKADLTLVADKVSRSEYATQIRMLQKTDDDIATRAVPREEYKQRLAEIRSSMVEEEKQREQNEQRLDIRLRELTELLRNKYASKHDLIHVSSK